jgi:hypothetical protein
VDHARISSAPNSNRLHAAASTYDWTKVPTLTALAIGVVVGFLAAAHSGPINPDSFGLMVAFP